MGRLRYTSVSGFPRSWLTTRMPYSGQRSPLVTPDVRISRIRRSQILLVAGVRKEMTVYLHRQQAQLEQVLIPGSSFPGTEGPLTPPAQMPDQTLAHEPADLAKSPPWIAELEVFPPACQVSIQPLDEFGHRHEAHACADDVPQLIPFPCQRPRRRFQIQIAAVATIEVPLVPESVPQKVQPGILL